MRVIEDLRDKYKGKEIWIMGTAPSLDDYPEGFFDNKIVIAINLTFRAFPTAFKEHNENAYIILQTCGTARWVIANRPDLLKRLIFPLPITKQYRIGYFGKFADIPIRMIWDRVGSGGSVPRRRFEQVIKELMEDGACRTVTFGTTLHNAIPAAVMMGGKKISLVGCDACRRDGRRYARRSLEREISPESMSVEHRKSEEHWFERVRRGTRWLAEILKDYGIEVRRYNYHGGYEEIK